MSSDNQETDELTLEPFKEGDDKNPEEAGQFSEIKGKRFLIIGAILLVIGAIIYGIYYFKRDDETNVSSSKQAAPHEKPTNTSYIFEMPNITTNLAPNAEKESWIKLGITLQLENNKDQIVLDKKLPMVKDAIIVFLRELRSSDLASSGGSMMLKNELLKRINKIMYPAKLRDVLLREILLDQ